MSAAKIANASGKFWDIEKESQEYGILSSKFSNQLQIWRRILAVFKTAYKAPRNAIYFAMHSNS